MRANTLTINVDSPTAKNGYVEKKFTDVDYHPTWNGVSVRTADGTVEFFDNVEMVGYQATTNHKR